MKRRLIYLLSAGHLVTDISQGALPALLPFFISQYHLSYTAAGLLVLASTIASSVVQPFFGYIADRVSKPWLVCIGPLLAGLGIAVTGLIHDYYLIMIAVSVSGLGVAAFHPEGARLANGAAGEKKASGMSIFSVGGNAGFAIGPLAVTGLMLVWGMKGTVFFILPAIMMSLIFFTTIGGLTNAPKQENPGSASLPAAESFMQDAWVPFILLTAAIICRSVIFQGLNTFLPLYWIDVFQRSKAVAGTALTLLFGVGIAGNIIGGHLADRFGCRKTVLSGFLVLIPLLAAFVRMHSVTAATLLLIPIGLTIFISFSPMIVMGQAYLPGRVGFSSGITIGLAVSVGGLAAPLLGRLADQAGIEAVFNLLTIFPVLAAALVFFLPGESAALVDPGTTDRS